MTYLDGMGLAQRSSNDPTPATVDAMHWKPIVDPPALPLPANDIPMIVMVGPQAQLRVQRALYWAVGVRFLGFRHADTALLALMTMTCNVVMVTTPADMSAGAFIDAVRAEGHAMPVIRLDASEAPLGEPLPQTPAAARSLLVRTEVLAPRIRLIS
jgi:hypothetical protein